MIAAHSNVDEKSKELQEKLKNETAPAFLQTVTNILKENGGQYMVGKEVSVNGLI